MPIIIGLSMESIMSRYWVSALVLISAFLASHSAAATSYYQGTMGDHREITMTLEETAGQYRYSQFGPPIGLKIDGTHEGEMRIAEKGGEFRGTVNTTTDFEGTWKSKDGKRSLPFNLEHIAESAEFMTKEPRFSVRYVFPQFLNTTPFYFAINTALSNDARSSVKAASADFRESVKDVDTASFPWESDTSVEILHVDEQMVSLLFTNYVDSGGAHGNTSYRAVTYIWQDNKLVELKPNEMIGAKADQTAIRLLIVAELKRRHANWADSVGDAKEMKFADMVINPTSNGLIFTFAPYEVDSYAGGTYCLAIPYKSLKEMIPAESALYRLASK